MPQVFQRRPGWLGELVQQAESLVGFNRLERNGDRLVLEYDAAHLSLDALIERLHQTGVLFAEDRWSQLRLGWYRYQDRNIRDNSRNTGSSSCSQSPLRHR